MSTKITLDPITKSRRTLASLLGHNPYTDESVTIFDPITILIASHDRILPVLAHRLAAHGYAAALDVDTKRTFDRAIREQAAMELNLRPELTEITRVFGQAGVALLLLKGAALAYTDYPEPFLRPRGDTDLLIRVADRPRAHVLLQRFGYAERAVLATPHISQQSQYVRTLPSGLEHTIDLHWRTFNPSAFAELLPFDDLWAARRPVPALGPGASAPGLTHTLLLSLLHRMAHHEPSLDLLWLFDIHLVAGVLSAGDWDTFFDMTARGELSGMCARGLDLTRCLFATRLSDAAVAWIAEELTQPVPSRFQVFQAPGRRVLDVVRSDLRLASTWRERVSLVREHLFPPGSYMTARYGAHRDTVRPFLYVHRAAAGMWRWLRRDLFR